MSAGWRTTGTKGYGLVLLLVAVAYVVAVAWPRTSGLVVVTVVQLLTIWVVFRVSGATWARRAAGVAVLVVLVATTVAIIAAVVTNEPADPEPGRRAFVAVTAVIVVLYALTPIMIMEHILRRRVVDAQTLTGAIAAYLLIGMTFAFAYLAVGTIQVEPPFFGDQGDATVPNSMFFSFTTLTTTGYGNLVPETNPGQTLAIAEVVIGQLFLLTALAKIVADLRRRPEGAAPA